MVVNVGPNYKVKMMYNEGNSPSCVERRSFLIDCYRTKLKQPNLKDETYAENKVLNKQKITLNDKVWKLRTEPPTSWPIPKD